MGAVPCKILVVDDEPLICSAISCRLAANGPDCQTTSDPQLVEELLSGRQFDVLISDIAMPGPLAVEKMLDELRWCAGTQFDPQIAATAVEWCNTNPNELILPAEPAETEALTWAGPTGVA